MTTFSFLVERYSFATVGSIQYALLVERKSLYEKVKKLSRASHCSLGSDLGSLCYLSELEARSELARIDRVCVDLHLVSLIARTNPVSASRY